MPGQQAGKQEGREGGTSFILPDYISLQHRGVGRVGRNHERMEETECGVLVYARIAGRQAGR